LGAKCAVNFKGGPELRVRNCKKQRGGLKTPNNEARGKGGKRGSRLGGKLMLKGRGLMVEQNLSVENGGRKGETMEIEGGKATNVETTCVKILGKRKKKKGARVKRGLETGPGGYPEGNVLEQKKKWARGEHRPGGSLKL